MLTTELEPIGHRPRCQHPHVCFGCFADSPFSHAAGALQDPALVLLRLQRPDDCLAVDCAAAVTQIVASLPQVPQQSLQGLRSTWLIVAISASCLFRGVKLESHERWTLAHFAFC